MFDFLKNTWKRATTLVSKISFSIGGRLRSLFSKKRDESLFEELEKLLFEADLGPDLAMGLTEKVRSLLKNQPNLSSEEILSFLQKELLSLFVTPPNNTPLAAPHVIMVVGVNGAGKTTTIAKLAASYQAQGKKVLIAAADTFRAAAIDQLSLWADRLGVDIVKSQPKADPAAVAFDALTSAKAKNSDLVIIDTAGRLQTKTDLMHELEKIRKVCKRVIPDAPHETLIVIDATTGQNGLDQIEVFHKFTPLSGIILSKFDGSAKGGIVAAIARKFQIPVRFLGTGEGQADLISFDPETFTKELLSID